MRPFSASPSHSRESTYAKVAFTLIATVASLLTGCGASDASFVEDLDLTQYEQLPDLNNLSLDLDAVSLSENITYWEFREDAQHPLDEVRVLGASGQLCDGAADEATCQADFEALAPGNGFGWHAHPTDMFYYFAVNQGEQTFALTSPDEVKNFLGTIDSKEKAILIALAEGYHWGNDKDVGAIKEVDGGYELIVLETVSYCTPLQSNRLLVRISTDATTSVANEEVFRQLDDHCA